MLQNYCNWLSSKDSSNKYRISSESEWELAAGHMPKDADFNNNIIDSRVSVNKYANVTRGAHGAIDFWGMYGNGHQQKEQMQMVLLC